MNKNEIIIEQQVETINEPIVPNTPPVIPVEILNSWKAKEFNKERVKEVAKIKVELNNITLDGDEKSQERISRAINALDPEETTYWIDASGEPQELTREDLKEALKLAGQKQTEIFVEYAQKKADLQA